MNRIYLLLIISITGITVFQNINLVGVEEGYEKNISVEYGSDNSIKIINNGTKTIHQLSFSLYSKDSQNQTKHQFSIDKLYQKLKLTNFSFLIFHSTENIDSLGYLLPGNGTIKPGQNITIPISSLNAKFETEIVSVKMRAVNQIYVQ